MNKYDQNVPLKRGGTRYSSFEAMLAGSEVSETVKDKVRHALAENRVTSQLTKLRVKAGLTQDELAAKMGKTQSAVSKLESGPDEGVTIAEIKAYSEATGQRIGIMFGKPLSHAEAIKHHALCMRSRMKQLAQLANADEDLEKEIAAFFGEAFFNLLSIMSECSKELPDGAQTGVEIRMETYEKTSSRLLRRASGRELAEA